MAKRSRSSTRRSRKRARRSTTRRRVRFAKKSRGRGLSAKINRALAKTQEQKLHDQDHSFSGGGLTLSQYGVDIAKGNDKDKRIGDKVHLKGVRVQYHFEQINPGSDSDCCRVRHYIYVVCVKRDITLANYWYLKNDDTPLPWNTVDGDGYWLHQHTRLNTKDYTVLGKKIMDTNPFQTNNSWATTNKTGAFYVPINLDIKWDDPSATLPYGQNKVRPNVFVVHYSSRLDDGRTGSATPLSVQVMKLFWYYRE